MSRVALLAALVYLVVVAGIGTLNGPLVGMALPLVLYLLAGLWRGPEELNLTAKRTLRSRSGLLGSAERIRPGETITVSLTVVNKGRRLEQVLLEEPLPNFLEVINGSATRLVDLPANGSISWTYTLRGRRGFHVFSGLNALAEDRLGLMSRRIVLPTSGQVFVLPLVARVRRIAIQPRQTRVYSGVIPANQGGAGIEFFGLREYQAGDSPHHINWRASARHEEMLYSNEFQQERVADVGIVLDGRRKVNEFGHGRSIFEESVLAAVAVSSALLSEGNRVGLFIYGKRLKWTSPGYGKYQRERIMQDLALAEIGESQNFNALIIPRRLFPPKSQLIIISPLSPGDLRILAQFHLKGYQLIVISPDPVSFEARGLGNRASVKLAARIAQLEREVLLRSLRRAGIQVVNWNTAFPFEQAARAALSRPPAYLRVIQRGDRG